MIGAKNNRKSTHPWLIQVKDGCSKNIRGTTLNLQTLRLYALQDTNISLATDVCVTSQNNQKFISKYTSFNRALRGPFDALRCARLSVIPTPCNCTLHRYLHFIGLKLLFD